MKKHQTIAIAVGILTLSFNTKHSYCSYSINTSVNTVVVLPIYIIADFQIFISPSSQIFSKKLKFHSSVE
jgi:hypothetical protein